MPETISRSEVFNFSNSLVSVTHKSGVEAQLPDAGELVRADEAAPPHLDAMFAAFNISRFKDVALRPMISWPLPSQLDRSMEDLQLALLAMAEADPELAAWAGAASKVLKDDMALQKLLRLYINSLIPC